MANPSVHYVGGGKIARADHDGCAALWNQIREQHLARGYADIAYNFGFCNHGLVLEGRGWDRDSAANGAGHNKGSRAFCWLAGDEDTPSDAAIRTLANLTDEAYRRGLVPPLRPHSSYVATACPGDAMRDVIDRLNTAEPDPVPVSEVTTTMYILIDDQFRCVLFGGNVELRDFTGTPAGAFGIPQAAIDFAGSQIPIRKVHPLELDTLRRVSTGLRMLRT